MPPQRSAISRRDSIWVGMPSASPIASPYSAPRARFMIATGIGRPGSSGAQHTGPSHHISAVDRRSAVDYRYWNTENPPQDRNPPQNWETWGQCDKKEYGKGGGRGERARGRGGSGERDRRRDGRWER